MVYWCRCQKNWNSYANQCFFLGFQKKCWTPTLRRTCDPRFFIRRQLMVFAKKLSLCWGHCSSVFEISNEILGPKVATFFFYIFQGWHHFPFLFGRHCFHLWKLFLSLVLVWEGLLCFIGVWAELFVLLCHCLGLFVATGLLGRVENFDLCQQCF